MFEKFFTRADEFYHTAQIDAFFKWLDSKNYPQPLSVLIDLPLQNEMLDGHRGASAKEGRCGFVICQRNNLAKCLAKFTQKMPEDGWHQIWYAEGIEIWENKGLHGDAQPLRFGLSLKEKRALLKFARETMIAFFNSASLVTPPDISQHRSSEIARIDVGIWIEGRMRGSIISPPLPLVEAVQYASLGTLRDARMKPVEPNELERARIEITIMSDLTAPLRQQDLEAEKIDACRGYYVEAGDKNGWYLPAVFNCLKFKNLLDVKRSLIKEKAKIAEEDSRIPLYTFGTESWIEGATNAPMLMEGSVAYAAAASAKSLLDTARTHGDKAAQWLSGMLDADGAMPLYTDPLYGRIGRINWGRLAHAAYALADYGAATGDSRLIRASEKISDYIQRYLFDTKKPNILIAGGVAIYLVHAALARGDTDYALLMEYIRSHPPQRTGHPIISAAHASLFARFALAGKGEYQAESESLARDVFLDFKNKKSLQGTQLALYPELMYAFKLLHSLTGELRYLEQSKEVAEWLMNQQLPNGSFPICRNSSFAYTRGTGKIFEVLALYPDHHSNAIEKSFEWLVQMQYTEDSLYFADSAHRNKAIGGFRHDHANTEVWIDSASHFLLGAARLLRAPVDK